MYIHSGRERRHAFGRENSGAGKHDLKHVGSTKDQGNMFLPSLGLWRTPCPQDSAPGMERAQGL